MKTSNVYSTDEFGFASVSYSAFDIRILAISSFVSLFRSRESRASDKFYTSRFIIKKLRKTLRLSKPSSRPIRDSIRRTSFRLWTKTATVHPLTVPSFPRTRIKLLHQRTSDRDAHLQISSRHQVSLLLTIGLLRRQPTKDKDVGHAVKSRLFGDWFLQNDDNRV